MSTLKTKPTTRRDAVDAARLQKAGQHGDTVLAHINPQEAKLLDLLADGLLDAPRNPKTGLLSFGMSDAEGPSGHDSNPGGVGGGPAGGQTGGGIGGNTADGQGGLSGGYGDNGYAGSANQRAAQELGDYYRDNYIGGLLDSPYAPKDTWTRVFQELTHPSVAAPGRYGAPNAYGPGIVGTMAANFAGPMMSGLMGIGAAMGRAQSPESQRASMAEQAATGAKNSTGQDRQVSPGVSVAEVAATAPGARSGAQTAAAPVAPPGYTVNPAGQIVPLPHSGNNRPAYQDPLRNLLMDYILRGRQGGGFGW